MKSGATLTASILFLIGVILAGATFTLAQSGDDAQIHACVRVDSGSIRIVEAGAECRMGEEHLAWSIQGETGPTGPTGPKGDQGPQGIQGPSGTIAHGLVQPTGEVVRAEGLTSDMVTPMLDNNGDPTGFVCFNVPFEFDVALVTSGSGIVFDEDGEVDQAFPRTAAIIYPGRELACGHTDVLVQTSNPAGDARPVAFTIVFF